MRVDRETVRAQKAEDGSGERQSNLSLVGVYREAVRAQKADEGRQRRVYRAKLLREQQAAMTAQQARLEAERALQITCVPFQHSCLGISALGITCSMVFASSQICKAAEVKLSLYHAC